MKGRNASDFFLGELKKTNRRSKPAAVLRVGRLFELQLQMNESAGSLDQAFEEIVVIGILVEPDLFENIVRFVVALLVPALKIRPVIGMVDDRDLVGIAAFTHQVAYKS